MQQQSDCASTSTDGGEASAPAYVYKLVSSTARRIVSTLDELSGFIHLSTASQVPATLRQFFASDPVVIVIRLAYAQVEKNIRWESTDGKVRQTKPGEGLFPHLYNSGRIGNEKVESWVKWENTMPGSETGWDDALEKAQSWLI